MRLFRKVAAGAAALAVASALSGCTSIKDHRGYIADQALVDAVQPGIDNMQSVEKSLGRPTFASGFGRKDWYYVSVSTKQLPFGRPRTLNESVLRVTFDANGNVATVNKSAMEHVASISPDHHATPTLGKHRGFLEDLFGNIGQVGAAGMGGDAGSGSGGGGRGPNGS